MLFLLILGLVFGYALFLSIRLGLHQRLPLALGPVSLERILDRAAIKYGEKVLFTSDKPCAWELLALQKHYPDPTAWSAVRIKATAGYLARMLQDQLSVQRGERVAIMKENHLDIHIFIASIVRAGGISCPVNGKFAAANVHPYIINIGSRVLISDSATVLRVLNQKGDFGCVKKIILAEKRSAVANAQRHHLNCLLKSTCPDVDLIWLEEALTEVREESGAVRRGKDETVYLVHTSGTTGFPKAVILKNGPQSHAVRGWLCYVHLSRSDKGYLAVPNNHQAVILTFNSLLLLGLPVHWASAYDRDDFDAEGVVRQLSEGGFTGFFGFPVTYTQLKEVRLEKYNLSRMKFWSTTADASHEAIMRHFVGVGGAFQSMGLPFKGSVYLDAQGSSEVGTPSVIRYITPFTTKFGRRVGRPGSTPLGPQIRVVKSNGELAQTDEVGRLEVKGKTVFDGYWNNHELTCHVIRDGWFFTGDVVCRGKDGHIIQLDREVDIIHTRDGDVYSLPIEEEIHKHPDVFDACVYGEKQDDEMQLPAVAVALRPGFGMSSEELRQELNKMLSEKARLHRLDIIPWDEFPMGVTGKTLKRVFRENSQSNVRGHHRRTLFRFCVSGDHQPLSLEG